MNNMHVFDDYDPAPREQAKCKHCDAINLKWADHGSGWRLYDANTLKRHECLKAPSTVASFSDFDHLVQK